MANKRKPGESVPASNEEALIGESEIGEPTFSGLEIPALDRIAPIQFMKQGVDLGINLYDSKDENVVFRFRTFSPTHPNREEFVSDLAIPRYVRTRREGGDYYRLEMYYYAGSSQIGDRIQGKSLFVQTGVTEKGQPKGKLFKGLLFTGQCRDFLDQEAGVRFDKLIFSTDQSNSFSAPSAHLPGLGLDLSKLGN